MLQGQELPGQHKPTFSPGFSAVGVHRCWASCTTTQILHKAGEHCSGPEKTSVN